MTSENFCFYLQNRLIQTSQTGGPCYSDTSPFCFPWLSRYKTKILIHIVNSEINAFIVKYILGQGKPTALLSAYVNGLSAFRPLPTCW
jgi:hypothetical protein